MPCSDAEVYTYGFSTRTWEETVGILNSYDIKCLVDVRTLPGSRRYPQFNIENLEALLPEVGIHYVHLKSLGGFRKSQGIPPELNAGWRNESFRNYADYMQTIDFEVGLEQLADVFKNEKTVYVCTEAVFWRCHRALISDALLIRGYHVGHIFTQSHCDPHRLTSFAVVDGHQVTYPAP